MVEQIVGQFYRLVHQLGAQAAHLKGALGLGHFILKEESLRKKVQQNNNSAGSALITYSGQMRGLFNLYVPQAYLFNSIIRKQKTSVCQKVPTFTKPLLITFYKFMNIKKDKLLIKPFENNRKNYGYTINT